MASARSAIVVTGGSRGIGAATVAALASRGYDVALAYRQDAAAAERVAAHAGAGGARCLGVQADVTREEDVERLFASAAEVGPVCGRVSNAGLTGHIGQLADTPGPTAISGGTLGLGPPGSVGRVVAQQLGAVVTPQRGTAHPDRVGDVLGAGPRARGLAHEVAQLDVVALHQRPQLSQGRYTHTQRITVASAR
jgi:NAD(P)-dependent dehydrogenase (short-subunit alcohol dehydrogenase family)